MALYSYLLAYDCGAAPNPFHRYCTLATCKPAIRRTAHVGDWIIATGRKNSHTYRKLVYAMRVAEAIPLEDYFRDSRFAAKKPDLKSKNWQDWVGDNIYRRQPDGSFTRLSSPYQNHDPSKDLRGKNALIADHFYYFGTHAVALPPSFEKLIHANQGHRNQFPHELVTRFLRWLEGKHEPGVHGDPIDAPVEHGVHGNKGTRQQSD